MDVLINDAILEIQTFKDLKIMSKNKSKMITMNGEHYYGRISGLKNDKWTFIELAHLMSQEFARELSSDDWTYHRGNLTQRFKTREDVIDFAIKNIQNIFPNCKRLLYGEEILWKSEN